MRAMLIDSYEICRSGFKYIFNDNFDDCHVCEASTIDEAVACLDENGTDIIVLTVKRQFLTNDPAFIRLREIAQNTPVIVLGEIDNRPLVENTFRYNFHGFLDRSTSKKIVVAAIQLVLAGGQYYPPEFGEGAERNLSAYNNFTRTDFDKCKRLTRRQLQVLQAISEGKPNKLIAEELGISPGTVKVHVSNLMKDLQATNRTQAVAIANSLNLLS